MMTGNMQVIDYEFIESNHDYNKDYMFLNNEAAYGYPMSGGETRYVLLKHEGYIVTLYHTCVDD